MLEGLSSIRMISRDPADLVPQTINANHQYPDGFVLFLGTMFAPTKDRDARGRASPTSGRPRHHRAPKLGKLTNRMRTSDACEPWKFGITPLMMNLAKRTTAYAGFHHYGRRVGDRRGGGAADWRPRGAMPDVAWTRCRRGGGRAAESGGRGMRAGRRESGVSRPAISRRPARR